MLSALSDNLDLKDQLGELRRLLTTTIIGQEEPIETIVASLERYLAGLHTAKAPIGTFLFIGPSGCGKSFLVEELARLTQPEDAFIRLDCSEYSLEHEVARLLGAPPGYTGSELGSQLTNKLNEVKNAKGGFILLLDEVEKAHPRFFDIWLQVFESGRFTDGKGNILDFSKALIFLTSNVGSSNYLEAPDVGFVAGRTNATSFANRLKTELRKTFRPEFLNRLTAQLQFLPLTQEQERTIFGNLLADLNRRLAIHEITIELSDEVTAAIFRAGFSKEYGARELKRTFVKVIEQPLAHLLIRGDINPDSALMADYSSAGDLQIRQIGHYPILLEASS